jgi:hypothetical protein
MNAETEGAFACYSTVVSYGAVQVQYEVQYIKISTVFTRYLLISNFYSTATTGRDAPPAPPGGDYRYGTPPTSRPFFDMFVANRYISQRFELRTQDPIVGCRELTTRLSRRLRYSTLNDVGFAHFRFQKQRYTLYFMLLCSTTVR